MDAHHKSVSIIMDNAKSFHDRGLSFRVYHGSTNSTRNMKLDPDKVIDTSCLSHILSIDPSSNTAIVEPNVAMDALVKETLKQGIIPGVVPEFPGITVGGAYSGTAAESSSFRYGYFDRIVNWVEIVVADGTLVTASREENADLFHGAAGALGTLGVTTLFEIQLIPTTKLIEVEYMPVFSIQDTLDTLKEFQEDECITYLDAILFSAFSGVVVIGRQQQIPSYPSFDTSPTVRFSRAKDPWFCLHTHSKVRHPCNTHCIVCKWEHKLPDHINPREREPALKELVPVMDYLFRYDRGAFWMSCYGWDNAGVPFNRFTRRLLDGVFRTRMLYKMMHNSKRPPVFIIQDLAIPTENAANFLNFIDEDLKIYPLWLCPIRGGSPAPLHTAKGYVPPLPPHSTQTSNKQEKTPTILNIGLWGLPNLGIVGYNNTNYHEFLTSNHLIEQKVREAKGLKWLYAHNYYTEEEFWGNYDRGEYEALRKEWSAQGLPSLWDKVKREEKGGQEAEVVGLGKTVKAFVEVLCGRNGMLEGKKKTVAK